jgi:hypothetical protein
MKGITLVSSVIFLGFLIAATGIVYYTGMPIMERMQCIAAVEKMKSSLIEMDKVTRDVVAEGKGSKRTIDMNIDEGKLYILGDNDTIYWEYDCGVQAFPPRTFQMIGNVMFGSNLDVKAYEGTCSGQDAFILENQHIKACFNRTGSSSSPVQLDTRRLLLSVYQKDLGQYMPLEYLEITLDDDSTSRTGAGYTYLEKSGLFLPYGQVTAHLASDYGITYDIRFVLESGGDFIEIRGE